MLLRLSGKVSRQLEVVAAGEERMNSQSPQHGGGGHGSGSDLASLREEALSLKAEESTVLKELAERQATVDLLADELCDTEHAVEEVGHRCA